jgi:hypothetical protein
MSQVVFNAERLAPQLDGEGLSCPICGYDLRGLTNPRCPECGTRFTWSELRDPAKKRHPYLFEHHPERNAWSFCRTLLAGFRPAQFWSTLLPIQRSNVRRLMLYAMIWTSALFIAGAAQLVRSALEIRQVNLAWRASIMPYYTGGTTGVHPGVRPASLNDALTQLKIRAQGVLTGKFFVIPERDAQNLIAAHGSIQNYVDYVAPIRPGPRMLSYIWGYGSNYGPRRFLSINGTFEILAAAALWPWLTALAFQIFRMTMHRAQIRPTHILRVAVYSGDVAVWLAIVLLAVILDDIVTNAGVTGAWGPPGGARWGSFMYGVILWAPVIAVILATVRLGAAVRRYLRFNHAVAIAVSVQIIVLLSLWKLHFVWHGQ